MRYSTPKFDPPFSKQLPLLRIIGLRLSALKSSSANVERIFSDIKNTQAPGRTNYAIHTLLTLTRIKLAAKDSETDALDDLYAQHLTDFQLIHDCETPRRGAKRKRSSRQVEIIATQEVTASQESRDTVIVLQPGEAREQDVLQYIAAELRSHAFRSFALVGHDLEHHDTAPPEPEQDEPSDSHPSIAQKFGESF